MGRHVDLAFRALHSAAFGFFRAALANCSMGAVLIIAKRCLSISNVKPPRWASIKSAASSFSICAKGKVILRIALSVGTCDVCCIEFTHIAKRYWFEGVAKSLLFTAGVMVSCLCAAPPYTRDICRAFSELEVWFAFEGVAHLGSCTTMVEVRVICAIFI